MDRNLEKCPYRNSKLTVKGNELLTEITDDDMRG